jgi:two-component system response regulator TctD
MVKRHPPDAIVLDLTMPRLNGIETLKQIRKLDAKVPVVVLTASTYPALHQTARNLGASEVYTKPVDLDRFARKILSLAPGGTA